MDKYTVYQDFRIHLTKRFVLFCRTKKMCLTSERTSQNRRKKTWDIIWINLKILFSQTTNLNCDEVAQNKAF